MGNSRKQFHELRRNFQAYGADGLPGPRNSFRPAGLTRDGRHSVKQILESYAVVDIGPGQQKGERDATSIRDQMAFGARPALVGRVRTCRGTPFWPLGVATRPVPRFAQRDRPKHGGDHAAMRNEWRRRQMSR
jgi:hypothetical protein